MRNLEEEIIKQKLSEEPECYKRNRHQSKPKKPHSSPGTISYRFSQLMDCKENRTFTPLVEALYIPPYDHILEEAIEGPIGLKINISYRRTTQEISWIPTQSMSYTTLNQCLQRFAQEHFPFWEMKYMAYEHSSGPFEQIGFWISTDWAQIRKDLEERLDYSKIEVFFSDGGPGIEDNLLRPWMEHQRYLYNGRKDFSYLLYADGVKKEQQRPLMKKLKSIPAKHLTKGQLEQLHSEDHPRIEAIFHRTHKGFQELLDALDPEKYPIAHTCIGNLIYPHTTFVRWWLHKRELIPLNTNAIESAFSQVCNRIEKVGRYWLDIGLLNWLKIAFYKVFSDEIGSAFGGKPEYWGSLWFHQQTHIPKIELVSIKA